ncbi:sugar phosphate isomerase/epimerase family protein [Neobacillus soli]|uniref:sugar phosphate isomerase/epimerase family protein n=1 Tax=Neobacillus soli TaxID=220688 RepID=UPI000825410D|nr:sugar phosphate isomerase/epimerase family protein [Neobacillus soli]
MKLGVQANAWRHQWNKDPKSIINHVKDIGFDFIEIPLMNINELDVPALKDTLKNIDLEVCTSTILVDDSVDITSCDEEVRKNGISYLKRCIDATNEMGAKFFSGIIYTKQFNRTNIFLENDLWKYSAEGLREIAQYAGRFGINIGIEPVNRFETCLINTCEQALHLKEMVGESNLKIHLDTFHMNIEEKSLYETIKLAGNDLFHVHLNENDLGIAGTGQVNWDDLFMALREINYEGYASIECVVDVKGNYVWRQLAPTSEMLVSQGRQFFRELMGKYGL